MKHFGVSITFSNYINKIIDHIHRRLGKGTQENTGMKALDVI